MGGGIEKRLNPERGRIRMSRKDVWVLNKG